MQASIYLSDKILEFNKKYQKIIQTKTKMKKNKQRISQMWLKKIIILPNNLYSRLISIEKYVKKNFSEWERVEDFYLKKYFIYKNKLSLIVIKKLQKFS